MRAENAGHPRLARALKAYNYVVFKAVLPVEVELAGPVRLWHRGLGTVIHPNTTFGTGVSIAHGVTIAADSPTPGGSSRVVIGDNVTIGAGAAVLARRSGVLRIGHGAVIGANAVVTRDVAAGATVVASQPVIRLPQDGDLK